MLFEDMVDHEHCGLVVGFNMVQPIPKLLVNVFVPGTVNTHLRIIGFAHLKNSQHG